MRYANLQFADQILQSAKVCTVRLQFADETDLQKRTCKKDVSQVRFFANLQVRFDLQIEGSLD